MTYTTPRPGHRRALAIADAHAAYHTDALAPAVEHEAERATA